MSVDLNPQEEKELFMVVGEITNLLSVISMKQASLTDAVGEASKKYGITKKQLRKLATTMFKQNFSDVQEEHEEFEYLYEKISKRDRNDS